MKHWMKRSLSLILALALVLSCGVVASAEENPGVAANTATGQKYDNLDLALREAAAGQTVRLTADTQTEVLLVREDTQLDLNGCTLSVDYAASFGDITDRTGGGFLRVARERMMLQQDNAQLPIRDGDGYRFFDVTKFNKAWQPEKFQFAFQPFLDGDCHDLLTADLDAAGITVNVRISWRQSTGLRSQFFVYNSDMVAGYLNSYSQTTGKYGNMFTLTLTGADGLEDLTFQAAVASDTGVEFVSEPVPAEPEEPEEPEEEISWAGKKITILGDSISCGAYPGILKELSGAELQNLAVSGSLLAGGITGKVSQVAEDADLVIVFGGTNDYWHKKTNIGAADSTDTKTFVGALRYIHTYLKTERPMARLLFVFPPDQTFQGKPCTTDFGYGTLEDFRAAFLNFCEAEGIHYLDLGETEFDSAQHSGDGVHPTAAGHQIIAQAIYDRMLEGLETSITVTRQVRLLPNVTEDLPEGALASAPGVVFSTAPYAYTDTSLFAGRHITRIGIPVKSVQALDENQTFTLSVVKTGANPYEYVSQHKLTLSREELGDFTTVNRWIYLDVDLQLAEDETLAFGMPDDTVSWGYSKTNQGGYNFRSATGSWTSIIKESILFDIYATETLEFTQTEHGMAAVTEKRILPNVLADFPESAISGGNPVEFTQPPYSYVNQSLFAGKRITKIGIPVQSVRALDENQVFTLSVIKTGSGAYQYVSQHSLKLPLEELGDSTTVNKWIYLDVDIPLAEDETLAFGGKEDTVIWAWKRDFANDAYKFRDAQGGTTRGIFFDICTETVLTYEDYQEQLRQEEERLEAEREQTRLEGLLREQLAGKGISILGDSISTFTGWSNNTSYNSTIGSNAVYYTGSQDGFAAVGETWWMQTITRSGLDLVVNNSWSGDEVTNRGVSRAQQLHNNDSRAPEIIAVYLGINDFRRGRTEDAFRTRYEEMITGMLGKYDEADVYLFTLLYTSNMESSFYMPAEVVKYNAIIREIAEKYGCTLVDIYTDTGITPENLSTYMGDRVLHPNYAGMDLITDCFLDALLENYVTDCVTEVSYTGGTQFDVAASGDEPVLTLRVSYGDGREEEITVTDEMYVADETYGKPDFQTPGTYPVMIRYRGHEVVLTIEVIKPDVLIETEEFLYGSYFDHDRVGHNNRITSGDYGKIRSADALLPAQNITIKVTDTNLTDYKVTLGFFDKDGKYTGRTGILPMVNGELTITAASMSGKYFRVNVYLYNGRFTKVPETVRIEVFAAE